jgi:hypothetical protein
MYINRSEVVVLHEADSIQWTSHLTPVPVQAYEDSPLARAKTLSMLKIKYCVF